MLVFALVLLWLVACLGVISVWVLGGISLDSPEASVSNGPNAPNTREPTTR